MNTLLTVKKGVKMITFALIVFLGLSISLVYLSLISPGKPEAFKDVKGDIIAGSISE